MRLTGTFTVEVGSVSPFANDGRKLVVGNDVDSDQQVYIAVSQNLADGIEVGKVYNFTAKKSWSFEGRLDIPDVADAPQLLSNAGTGQAAKDAGEILDEAKRDYLGKDPISDLFEDLDFLGYVK